MGGRVKSRRAGRVCGADVAALCVCGADVTARISRAVTSAPHTRPTRRLFTPPPIYSNSEYRVLLI
jgi:hypothetical protein